jgi:hypothetical protein
VLGGRFHGGDGRRSPQKVDRDVEVAVGVPSLGGFSGGGIATEAIYLVS